jgi:excisionase family DNA binding protein
MVWPAGACRGKLNQTQAFGVIRMEQPAARFLTLEQVAEELNTSVAQIYALVRRGELAAIRLGGRGQWRVERRRLEEFIETLYEQTQRYVRDNPLTGGEDVSQT